MLRAPLFALLGTVGLLAAFAVLRPTDAPEPPVPTADHRPARIADAPADARIENPAPAVVAEAERPRAVRDVTPTGMTAGPLITGALPRIEPEPEPVLAEAPPPEARTERIFSPVIAAAGIVRIGDREIRLAGIEAPGAKASCGTSAWPCGAMARAALRRFIRGRALDCAVPAGASEIPDDAVCSVAGENLSRWLVAQGWAEATDEAYIGIEIGARDDRLGMWAEARPDAQEDVAGEPASSPESAFAINERVSGTP